MSTLHIVIKSPFAHNALSDCLQICGDADILLIEDGVNAAITNSTWAQQLKREGLRVSVLQTDIDARGLADRIDPAFMCVDAAGFVQLCCNNERTLSWF